MNSSEINVLSVLRTVFGYENFKNDVQKEATIAIYKGSRNVCISAPPGHGKSLCFQLPILLRKGKIGIVFSPKLSFIKHEVDFLRSKHLNASILSKGTLPTERNRILKDLLSDCPTIILLYATPDMGAIEYFKTLVVSLRERTMLSYVVFNEAHCLSKWGYDYAPTYKNLDIYEMLYDHIPRIAVTTTVRNEVIEDICDLLELTRTKMFRTPVQQLNVHYDVWFLDTLSHPINHLKSFIVEVLGFLDSSVQKMHKERGIIYCREVAAAEWLNVKLNTLGVSAVAYHHKLCKNTKHSIERKWISGETCIIITTYDYGFLHAHTIRCIVYWTVPENIAKYYRDCAQAHVANDRGHCRIYFSTKEYSSVRFVIENHRVIKDMEHVKKRLNEYDKIVSLCLLLKCRHAIISKYFGCIMPPCKTNCDVCENKEMVEIRTLKFIAYAESMEGIKYNICDVNQDVDEEQLENVIKTESKESGAFRKKMAVAKGTDKPIEQFNDKLQGKKRKRSFAECRSLRVKSAKDCIQTSAENAMEYAKDNTGTISASKLAITHSLLDKYNLNKQTISLELCDPKKNVKPLLKRTTNTQDFNSERDLKNESRVETLSEHSEIKVEKKKDRVSRRNSGTAVAIETEQPDKKSRKRFITSDAFPEDFQTKRRKLYPENKPTTATGINGKGGNGVHSYRERIKNDANGNTSGDDAMIEYVMNKYKLSSHSITLVPQRK